MGRRTTLTAENGTISTGNILAVISTAASGSAAANVNVSRVEITQSGSTTLAMIRGAFSTRTGGAITAANATAPQPTQPVGGAASAFTGSTSPNGAVSRTGTFSTADATPTYVDHRYFNFANLNGYLWKPDGEGEEIEIPPSTVWVVRFLAAPGTTTGWTITIDIEEQ